MSAANIEKGYRKGVFQVHTKTKNAKGRRRMIVFVSILRNSGVSGASVISVQQFWDVVDSSVFQADHGDGFRHHLYDVAVQ